MLKTRQLADQWRVRGETAHRRQHTGAWTLIVEPAGRPGTENMAIDYALLSAARAGVGLLRLYRWSPPCLSFGRNEPARTRYAIERITALGLDTVRRPTGGRAVWHEAELTYAVAGPVSMFGSLRETYISVHTMLAAAIRRLGVPAELAPRPSGRAVTLSGGACFGSPVGGEVIAGGRKLVGSAQLREGEAFLQHGSVLLENNQDVVAQVTRGLRAEPAATSLRAALDRPVTFDEVAQAVSEEARLAWTGTWNTGTAPQTWNQKDRFADPEWTWRR